MHKLYNRLISSVAGYTRTIISHVHQNEQPDFLNSLGQTVFQLDDGYDWIYLNSEWEILTGYAVNETIGTSALQYIHPDDRQQFVNFIKDLYKNSPHSSSLRTRLLSKNKKLCWTHIRANTFYMEEVNKTYLIGIISDISERVREYGLHLANYRTISTLINNLCGLVYRGRNDYDWTMEFVSDGCHELTGYPASELVNQTVAFGSLINPNDKVLVWNNVQAALKENRPYELNYRIITRDGTEKWVWERGKGNFSTNGELLSIEGFIVDITDYKKNKLQEIDELLYKTKTKLPQKHLFLDRLSVAIERYRYINEYRFAVLIIHLDRFSKLQNTLSSDLIDNIIIEISERIRNSISETDSLCLYGDGEFSLLLEHITTVNELRKTISIIREALHNPVKIKTTDTFITASIGAYLSEGIINDRKSVMKSAYAATDRAISLGGSCYEFFDESMNMKIHALDRMERELFHALQNDELLLSYQPLLTPEKNITSIMETRLFWNHPRRGKISSTLFSEAGRNNKIVNIINAWIMKSVINHIISWEKKFNIKQDFMINIRFFGENIFTENFFKQIEHQMLDKMPYSNFQFSIYMPANITNSLTRNSIEIINRLYKRNIRPIIFTENFILSSDEDLLKLPIDFIRFDIPLLKKTEYELKILKSRIDYIHALGAKVIINDVDSDKKRELVIKLGCDYILGDIISPPLSEDRASDIITYVHEPYEKLA